MRMNRFVATCAILACALGAAGCFESLTSIATPDKVVFYPDLGGDYRPPGPGGGRVHTHIARAEGKAYTYVQYDDKGAESTKGTLRLVKLGEHHFFEITLDNLKTAEGRPISVIGRLVIEGEPGAKTITGYTFKSKEEFLKDPAISTAEFSLKQNGETKKARAVSTPPQKLQAYLAAHAKDLSEETVKLQQSAGK